MSVIPVRYSPLSAESPPSALTTPITRNDQFFVRTNFDIPALSSETHRLSVENGSGESLDLSIDELRSLGIERRTVTLECAGNSRIAMAPLPMGEMWGGSAISTAEWSGVPLHRVLERAGVPNETVEILIEGADTGTPKTPEAPSVFARSLPLEKALHPDTLLALEMNGEPLPREHGAPIRLVVPGWYGMASVKWVRRIAPLDRPFDGYFQSARYVYESRASAGAVPVTTMRVKSMIVSPIPGSTLAAGPVVLRGWAWSGDALVTNVDVSLDGGEWRQGRLVEESTPYVWCAWEFEWSALEPGRHIIRTRAMDAAGNVQPERPEWNRLGYGNNAVQHVCFDVQPVRAD